MWWLLALVSMPFLLRQWLVWKKNKEEKNRPMFVPVQMYCFICGAESDEYTTHPRCRKCKMDVCVDCGKLTERFYSERTRCLECMLPGLDKIREVNFDPPPGPSGAPGKPKMPSLSEAERNYLLKKRWWNR